LECDKAIENSESNRHLYNIEFFYLEIWTIFLFL
jgi:hypothetical protein